MFKWKRVLVWTLVASMLVGSFIPVQVVQATQESTSEETTQESTNEETTQEGTSEETTQEDTSEETTQENTSEEATSESTSEAPTDDNKVETPTQNDTNQTIEDENALKDSEKVVSTLSPLTAKVIVLDPGHCATHPGAYGNGLREEVVVMDITEACRDALTSYGDVTLYLTREDGSCCRDLDLGGCLIARNNYAKILDADFLVSMHINAGRTNGANVLAAYKSGYNDHIRVETQKFGKIALKELKKLGITNRGLLLRKSGSGNKYPNGKLADYYSIVRNGVRQQIPSVIIEHGYISSASDCKKFFKTESKRKKVGIADAKAIIAYYGLNQQVIAGEFQVLDNHTYYVTEDGRKLTGWIKKDEKWYYLDEKTGVMRTGFFEYQGQTFYLTPLGEMAVGWFEVNGATYLARGNGSIVKGQTYSDGIYTYLFNIDGTQMKNGFYTMNSITYYVDNEGYVASGVKKINGKYYGFDTETNALLYGYNKVNGKYYYFDEATGIARTKTMLIVNGKQYYFGAKGARAAGWVKYQNKKYYFNKKNGVMVKGWKKINKKYYYFHKTTGQMQKSKWIGKYYVNSKGVRTKKRK